MDHIAIDLGSRESQACVRASDGSILLERRVRNTSLRTFLGDREAGRVIVETCAEAFKVADIARACGHDVRVVPSSLSHALGVGARRLKTDVRDARALSEASCRMELPSVHVPSKRSREWKSRCGMRDVLVETRTKLVNNVRGWLRTQGRPLPPGTVARFTERVRKLYEEKSATPLPAFVEQLLVAIDQVSVHIAAATRELDKLADSDDVCTRLKTIPGVGTMTSLRFVSTIDDVERFASAHAVQSYLGVVPGERSSSQKQRRTGINKAGASRTRAMLVAAAWAAWRSAKDDPMVTWAKQIELRRGKQSAIVALARKLAGILFALWRDGTGYAPRPAPSPLATAS